MSKRSLLMGVMVLAGLSMAPGASHAKWISTGEVSVKQGRDPRTYIEVQNGGTLQYWIGQVDEFEFVPSGDDMVLTGKVKVRITYTSDRSPYSCGQTVVMNMSELKDANARAWSVKKCH